MQNPIEKESIQSKLSDADSENTETLGWLDFVLACGYIQKETKIKLEKKNIEVGKLINYMMNNPSKFK